MLKTLNLLLKEHEVKGLSKVPKIQTDSDIIEEIKSVRIILSHLFSQNLIRKVIRKEISKSKFDSFAEKLKKNPEKAIKE